MNKARRDQLTKAQALVATAVDALDSAVAALEEFDGYLLEAVE